MKKGGMKTNTLIHINIETSTANVQSAVAVPHQTILNDKEKTENEVQDDTEKIVAEVEKEITTNRPEERDHVHLEDQDHHEIDMTDQEKIDMTMIDQIDMVEITIEIENAVIVIMIITNHLVTKIVAIAEPEIMTANSSSQLRRSIHISNAKRKIRMPLAKTACSGMDSNGSRKHKGNMILSNQILLYRKTRKASKKPRRE